MSTQVTVRTNDGRFITGISYNVGVDRITSQDPTVLAQGMAGGMAFGVFHIHTQTGWVEIQASDIAYVAHPVAGAST